MKKPPKQLMKRNPFIIINPVIPDATMGGTRAARSLQPKGVSEETLLEAKRKPQIVISARTSNHTLGQLAKRRDNIGAQARAERDRRRRAAAPKSKNAALDVLKRHILRPGSVSTDELKRVNPTIKKASPRTISRAITQAAKEAEEARRLKDIAKKAARAAVKEYRKKEMNTNPVAATAAQNASRLRIARRKMRQGARKKSINGIADAYHTLPHDQRYALNMDWERNHHEYMKTLHKAQLHKVKSSVREKAINSFFRKNPHIAVGLAHDIRTAHTNLNNPEDLIDRRSTVKSIGDAHNFIASTKTDAHFLAYQRLMGHNNPTSAAESLRQHIEPSRQAKPATPVKIEPVDPNLHKDDSGWVDEPHHQADGAVRTGVWGKVRKFLHK